MFTVKWVAENGSEALWLGMNLNFTPAKENKETGKPCLSFELGPETGFSRVMLDNGRIFVMNPQGKTVADYDFN